MTSEAALGKKGKRKEAKYFLVSLSFCQFRNDFGLCCATNYSVQLSVVLIFLSLTPQEENSTSAAASYLWLCCWNTLCPSQIK